MPGSFIGKKFGVVALVEQAALTTDRMRAEATFINRAVTSINTKGRTAVRPYEIEMYRLIAGGSYQTCASM